MSRFFHQPVLVKIDNYKYSIKDNEIFVTCETLIPKMSAFIIVSLHPTKNDVSLDSKKIENEYRMYEEESAEKC